MYKFSVIIPVYNVEQYLNECLESVIGQTYSDFEVIIVNDKSPDNSQDIINYYAKKDNRIRYKIHNENKGLGGARNTGIQMATGDYIIFVDSDDYIHKDTLKEIANEINLNDSDIIKFGRVEKFPDKEKIWLPKHSKNIYYSGWDDIKEMTLKNNFNPICWTNSYKRTLITKNDILFPEKLLFEDFYFTIQTLILSNKISYIDKPLYYWRKEREGSITYTINDRDIEICNSLYLVESFLEKNKKDEILNSPEYSLLIYLWSSGTTIYRYLKMSGHKEKKHRIINFILNCPIFRKHLKKVSCSGNVPLKMKISAYLLDKNFYIFKKIYSLIFKYKLLKSI